MLLSLDEILQDAHIHVKDSAYANDSETVRKWVMASSDFFEVVQDEKEAQIYRELSQKKHQADRLTQESEILYHRLNMIQLRLKELKNEEEDLTHIHAEEIKQLRQEKKELNARLLPRAADDSKYWLVKFKNCLYATSFSTIGKYIPQMKKISFRCVHKMPLFTAGVSRLKRAVEEKRPIAVSGGPCLFGLYEVSVILKKQDGTCECYDFSSGQSAQYSAHIRGLAEALEGAGEQIAQISFINHKRGITSQEYDSIQCLFECASALQARLTIPLPDMSYIKYFRNITQDLSPDVAQEAREKFRKVAFEICDMYLELIEHLKLEYPQVQVAVVHERDAALCRKFYQGREPFLGKRLVRHLSDIPGKADSILDYITMPALPYYLWGITDIIQMDSLDETDSYRKSCQLHKGKVKLYAMLYPERLSKDGKHTIFYAPLPYKEYLCDEGGDR